jgi:hypothetical protein
MATTTPVQPSGPAIDLGQQQYKRGQGLLNTTIAGNGVGLLNSNVAPNSWNGSTPQLQRTAPANPWLRQQGAGIMNQTNEMLGKNLLNIQGNQVGAGTLGGSRQGIAQGTAMGQASNYLSANLADMYGSAYESDANRNMQRYGIDSNSYNTQRGQDVGMRGQDQDFYASQRAQDMDQTKLGSDLINRGLNTQWLPMQNAADVYSKFAGYGTTTNSSSSGGGWQGALGGAMAGYQYGNANGWWGGTK